MNIGAPTLLASFAYQQAGGGTAGVSAALASLESSARDVTQMVKQIGSGQTFDLLELSKTSALDTATYNLQAAAGKGTQAMQDLLNPPTGYSNPLLTGQTTPSPYALATDAVGAFNLYSPPTQTVLNADVVGAYGKYQYAQAEKAGQGNAATQQATTTAANATQGFQPGLHDSAMPRTTSWEAISQANANPKDSNQDGLVSPAEILSYALKNPYYDPKDTNLDGLVSPAEELAYSLSHPVVDLLSPSSKATSSVFLDPKDANQDGFVSPAEELTYSLRHPGVLALKTQGTLQTNTAGANPYDFGTQMQTYSQYGANGGLNAFGRPTGLFLDLTA